MIILQSMWKVPSEYFQQSARNKTRRNLKKRRDCCKNCYYIIWHFTLWIAYAL